MTGQELLEKIKLEKEKLIKEGKIKKEKPLPEIKEEEIPFEIPEDWVWCRLGEVSIVGSGVTPKKEFFDISGIPFFRISDMNLEINNTHMNYTESYLKESYNKNTIEKPSVIFPKNGGAIFTNKRRIINKK